MYKFHSFFSLALKFCCAFILFGHLFVPATIISIRCYVGYVLFRIQNRVFRSCINVFVCDFALPVSMVVDFPRFFLVFAIFFELATELVVSLLCGCICHYCFSGPVLILRSLGRDAIASFFDAVRT